MKKKIRRQKVNAQQTRILDDVLSSYNNPDVLCLEAENHEVCPLLLKDNLCTPAHLTTKSAAKAKYSVSALSHE